MSYPYKLSKLTNGDYLIHLGVNDWPVETWVTFRGNKGDWYVAKSGVVAQDSWARTLDGILKLEEWKEIDQSNPT